MFPFVIYLSICIYKNTEFLPFIIEGPLNQSSPLRPWGKNVPLFQSTTFASMFGANNPSEE